MTGQDVEMTGQSSPLQTQIQSHHCCCHLPHSLGRFLPVDIITSCHGLAEPSVPLHGICAHCEIVEAVDANKAQVVVHGPQVIYHCPLILAFFPTPQTECYATLPLQGLGWVDALQAHYFWWLIGCYNPKEVDVLGRGLGKLFGGSEILLPPQFSCTSWILVPRRLAEVAICQNVLERSSDTSCLKLGQWVL